MPPINPTQHRSVRISDEVWDRLGHGTAPYGGRASVLRRLIQLYLTDAALRRRVAALPDDLARDVQAVTAGHSA